MLPLGEYHKMNSKADKHQSACKDCHKAYINQWRADNRVRNRAYRKAWYHLVYRRDPTLMDEYRMEYDIDARTTQNL